MDRGAENASSGPGDGEGLARGDVREKNAGAQIAGIGSEISSPSGSRDELSSEAGDAPSGLPRSKSRLGLSSNSASRDNLAAMAEPAADAAGSEPEPRRKGGSLDFRVKGRILEDKTLRLRLKIGDASGHTRTVEFPFNTDTDSSYSVASEMVDELQLAQSDIRTIMNEIENEVKFLNEGKKKMEEGDAPAPAQAAVSETTSAQKARSSAPELGGYSSGDGASGSVGSATDDPLAVAPRRAAVAAEGGVACARRRAAGGAGVPGDGAAGVSGRDRDTPRRPGGHRGGRRGGGARGGGARRRRRPRRRR